MNYKMCFLISGLSLVLFILVGCCTNYFQCDVFPPIIGYCALGGMILPFSLKVVGDVE